MESVTLSRQRRGTGGLFHEDKFEVRFPISLPATTASDGVSVTNVITSSRPRVRVANLPPGNSGIWRTFSCHGTAKHRITVITGIAAPVSDRLFRVAA